MSIESVAAAKAVADARAFEMSQAGTDLGVSSLLVDAFGKDDENLRKAWAAFIKNDVVEFKRLFLASNFYTKNNKVARSRKLASTDQTEVYQDALKAYKIATNKRLIASGIKLNETDLDTYATQAYNSGMDDAEVDTLLITANKANTVVGGSIGGEIQSLKAYANSFGVGTMQNWQANSSALFAGSMTAEEMQAKIRQDAASAYPAYAAQFDKGTSLDAVASAYKSVYSSVMEVDPDSVSFENPVLQKALQYKNEKGEATAMPTWLFSKELKKEPAWAMTNNARDSLDSKTTRVLSDMGLI